VAEAGHVEDLIDAATYGDTAAVQALLAKGAEVNTKTNDGRTALMAASEEGQREVVRALLEMPWIRLNDHRLKPVGSGAGEAD